MIRVMPDISYGKVGTEIVFIQLVIHKMMLNETLSSDYYTIIKVNQGEYISFISGVIALSIML